MNSTKGSPRGTYGKTAAIVGVLFVIGTVAGVLSRVLTGPLLSTADMLHSVVATERQITLAAFLVLTMGVALAMIPVVAFPLLRRHNETLALGYVVFRGVLEGMTYMGIAVSWLLLLPLSHVYQPEAAQTAPWQALGKVLLEGTELGVVLMIVFSLGGLMLYAMLYQSKLVPRWLSAWGVVAISLNLAAGLLALFGQISPLSDTSTVLQLPIFLQEMVLAVWLIARGFNPSAIALPSARPAIEPI